MRTIRKKRKNKYSILILIVIFIGIGFAALTTGLSMIGDITTPGINWNVYFDNLLVYNYDGNDVPTITSDKTGVEFEADLIDLDSEGTVFTVDAVNSGSYDVMISDIITDIVDSNGESVELPSEVEYSVTYINEKPLEKKHKLSAGTRVTYKVKMKYKDNTKASDLSGTAFSGLVKLTIKYEKADEEAKVPNTYISDAQNVEFCTTSKIGTTVVDGILCKRASTLHSDQSNGGYFGNCGTRGQLNRGDAFTCDVNGDGTYDETNERFYYVAPRDGDESTGYVALIWYDFYGSRTSYSQYNETPNPSYAIKVLPTYSDWPNVRLFSNIRNILDQDGNVASKDFDYAGYSARLLNLKELIYTIEDLDLFESSRIYAEQNGEKFEISPTELSDHQAVLDKNYLYQNYGFGSSNHSGICEDMLLENPYISTDNYDDRIYSWYLDNYGKTLRIGYSNGCVKPVIEVDLNEIEY